MLSAKNNNNGVLQCVVKAPVLLCLLWFSCNSYSAPADTQLATQITEAAKLFARDNKAGEAAFSQLVQQQSAKEQRLRVQQALCLALAPARPEDAIALTEQVNTASPAISELWQLRFRLCQGYAEERLGDNDLALEIYNEVVLNPLTQQDRELQNRALILRAEQYARIGVYPKALADLKLALANAQQQKDLSVEVYIGTALANLYADPAVADYQDAILLYERTLAYHRNAQNTQGEAIALFNLGSTYESMGNFTQALHYLQQTLELEQQRQQPDDIAYTQRAIAKVLTKAGRATEAVLLLNKAIEHYQSTGNGQYLAYCQLSRAISYKALGHWQLAEQDLAATVEYFNSRPNPRFEAKIYEEYADVQAQQGNWQRAFTLLQRHMQISQELQQQLLDQRTSELKTQLQTEQIRSEKALLTQKNQRQRQQLQDAEQLRLWQFVALSCATLLIAALLVLMQRQRKLSRQLADMALLDELTRLPNRRHTLALADQLWQQANRSGTPLAMLALDIDFFKRINDTFGHQAGDTVLRKVARSLRLSLRPQDKVGRVGGEEFLILLPATQQSQALEIAQRLCLDIAALTWPELTPGKAVTISIGVASKAQQTDLMQLWHDADTALYQAKHQGRNQAVLFQG